jgi:hypothetical protein
VKLLRFGHGVCKDDKKGGRWVLLELFGSSRGRLTRSGELSKMSQGANPEEDIGCSTLHADLNRKPSTDTQQKQLERTFACALSLQHQIYLS